jgi:hypothetical protein
MQIGLNFIIGIAAIAYGLYCYSQMKFDPEKIEKLNLLIERNGEKMGRSIYLFGHVILPVVAGILLLLSHFRA